MHLSDLKLAWPEAAITHDITGTELQRIAIVATDSGNAYHIWENETWWRDEHAAELAAIWIPVDQAIVRAIQAHSFWKRGYTAVIPKNCGFEVTLQDCKIAWVKGGSFYINACHASLVLTCSRLNATLQSISPKFDGYFIYRDGQFGYENGGVFGYQQGNTFHELNRNTEYRVVSRYSGKTVEFVPVN